MDLSVWEVTRKSSGVGGDEIGSNPLIQRAGEFALETKVGVVKVSRCHREIGRHCLGMW